MFTTLNVDASLTFIALSVGGVDYHGSNRLLITPLESPFSFIRK
jgi:hypothetical protein